MRLVKNIDDFRELTIDEVNSILLLERKKSEIEDMPENEKFQIYRDISNEIEDMKNEQY